MSIKKINNHLHKRNSQQKKLNQRDQVYSSSSDEAEDTHIQEIQQPSLQSKIQFGQDPVQIKCPFCLQNIRSEIILKPEFISIIFGFSLFIIFPHLVTLIVTIILLQITSTKKHRCPLCQRELGSDGKFLVFFQDEMYSFALGTNGIIISKKILASIGIGAIVCLIISLKMTGSNSTIKWIDLSWNGLVKDCPDLLKSDNCIKKYEGLTIKNWKGFVMRVEDNRNSYRKHFQYAVSIFVKINEPSTLENNRQEADWLLTINNYQSHLWQQILDNLSHGDEVEFNATFQSLRNNRGIPFNRHLNVVDLNKTGNKNSFIHVYMSHQEDLQFFQNLSGEKLRRQNDETGKQQQKERQKQEKRSTKKKRTDSTDKIQK